MTITLRLSIDDTAYLDCDICGDWQHDVRTPINVRDLQAIAYEHEATKHAADLMADAACWCGYPESEHAPGDWLQPPRDRLGPLHVPVTAQKAPDAD